MRSRFAHRLACALVAIGIAMSASAATPADEKPLPAEAFFKRPSLRNAALSPNGRYLGTLQAGANGRVVLGVIDLKTMTANVAVGFSDADVRWFAWVNDDRLVFDFVDMNSALSEQRAGTGLSAVNRDGSGLRELVDRIGPTVSVETRHRERLPRGTHFHGLAPEAGSNDILVLMPIFNGRNELAGSALLRVDTVTGHAVSLSAGGPGDARYWVVDWKGVPRAALGRPEGDKTAFYYRDSAQAPWRVLMTQDSYAGPEVQPVAFGPDGTLYVQAAEGRDTYAIYRYDVARKAVDGAPLFALKGYDVEGGSFRLDYTRQRILGLGFEAETFGAYWWDKTLAGIQAGIDKALPGHVNVLSMHPHATAPLILVRSFSDRDPGSYYLFRTDKGSLERIGAVMPGIDPASMAQTQVVRFKARDGLEIAAQVTVPPRGPKKNLPAVILVHGGPWVRGLHWGWDPEAQFLASRGYAVMELDFRGSTGYGFKHFKAGWKQWGLAMQDDVTDGTRWLIGQGIADARRICIAGASYGGFAVLSGMMKEPDLYRCGVEWVGVSDIDLMYDIAWSDMSEEWTRFGMPVLIGDREKDAKMLKAVSPLMHPERITKPLLMGYGGMDFRVPLPHGEKMRDALRPHNPNVEWIQYPEEGHGWFLVQNNVDFWTRVEAFLARNLAVTP